MTVESEFLTFSADKLTQLMGRIETCVRKLTPEQIWMRVDANQNAVGNLLLHLNGNVRQWILQGVSGPANVPDREAGIGPPGGGGADEFLARPPATVEGAASVLQALPAGRLMERI